LNRTDLNTAVCNFLELQVGQEVTQQSPTNEDVSNQAQVVGRVRVSSTNAAIAEVLELIDAAYEDNPIMKREAERKLMDGVNERSLRVVILSNFTALTRGG
jgi:hypothetical protein